MCGTHYRRWMSRGTTELKTTEERFWEKVEKRGPDDCWEWQATKYRNGYGNIWVPAEGRKLLAHRYSYALANGPIPDGFVVCHTCDNRSCVNPGHLWMGTQGDNLRDMVAKGRQKKAWMPHASHCSKGHDLAVVGTLDRPLPSGNTTVVCRKCRNDWQSAEARRLRSEEAIA